MQNSLSPRWDISDLSKSYQVEAVEEETEAFSNGLSGTVQAYWDDVGKVDVGICAQTNMNTKGYEDSENT